jgi:hypothetical protein
MKCIQSLRWVGLAVCGAALLGIVPAGHRATAEAQTRNEGELTAQWWQWVLGIPASENPLLDETGEDAGVGQPYKGNKVFFLCGVFNATGTAERSITVPQGTAFFFPLVNFVYSDLKGRGRDRANNPTVPGIYDIVGELADGVDSVYVTVDGTDLTEFSERVASPPFAIRLPDDNLTGDPAGVYTPAVADGYWFYLPPLKKGTHTLKFGGSAFDGGFVLDITYDITVN